jgi:hypothetical protein
MTNNMPNKYTNIVWDTWILESTDAVKGYRTKNTFLLRKHCIPIKVIKEKKHS